jgi:UDP-N-acetylmuramoylalanine--D-glutamate ligase
MSRWLEIKNVVVVGLGITGLSVVNYLERLNIGLSIRVIDTRLTPPGIDELSADIERHIGSWNSDWLLHADLVVVNPGIALATPELQLAAEAGIQIVGDIELFGWHVDKPIIAITGSNGKSTVTDLTGVLIKASGLSVGVGGNIGVPALDLISDDIDVYVLELSSFQLETTSNLALKAAAFLNLSEDHMDRYSSNMDAYRDAKLRIFDHAAAAVVNADDLATVPTEFAGNLVRFSLNQATEYCVGFIDGVEYFIAQGQAILPVSSISLVGRHNVANVLTVLALLEQSEIDYRDALSVLKSYTGLSHRCEVVADKRGIKWVNDSKATNVASTLAALSGLSCAGRLYLLVGGVGKGADFFPLAPELAKLNVKLCCFGRDGVQFMPLHPSAQQFDSMEQIVAEIAPELRDGDIVMLSPACASLDQFKNFMARGDLFAELAQRYA